MLGLEKALLGGVYCRDQSWVWGKGMGIRFGVVCGGVEDR